MKHILVFCVCLNIALAYPKFWGTPASTCDTSICSLPDCKCSNDKSPLDLDKTPQLISLTFDEAVVNNHYNNYWSTILSRTNPDGAQIGATFFVPHEYTDYTIVNELYNAGLEMAVHSITKNSSQQYWRTANKDTLVLEFQGQRQIMSKFANIPIDDIVGVRTPQLQLNGNVSIQAFVESGILYDNSQPTMSTNPLFPYTLDYKTKQQCVVAPVCPTESFPGFWVLPILNLVGNGKECNTLGDCLEDGTKDDIKKWLDDQLAAVKKTKAPLTLRISTLWFEQVTESFDGLLAFLDGLAEQKDVFLVNQKQIIDWMKNPVSYDQFQTDTVAKEAGCNPVNCRLVNNAGEERYLNSCVQCPYAYPWLGNPEGK